MNNVVEQDQELDLAQESCLRAWLEGMSTTKVVERYLPHRLVEGSNSRKVINDIRRTYANQCRLRRRIDLAFLFDGDLSERPSDKKEIDRAIAFIKSTPPPTPDLEDPLEMWFGERIVRTCNESNIKTLDELRDVTTKRKMWWMDVPGMGRAMGKHINAFFSEHASSLRGQFDLVVAKSQEIIALEQQFPVSFLNGQEGVFRIQGSANALNASNDVEAAQMWIQMHETMLTQRAYKKEVERLILWSVYQRQKAISSLTLQDALDYREFLQNPMPAERWIGPTRHRAHPEWKPFTGPLSSRSTAYTLQVLSGLFRFLIDKGYTSINPFGGVKVKGSSTLKSFDKRRAFTQGEWKLVRVVAEGMATRSTWTKASCDRLCFLLDFTYSTGLRAHELVGATLADIEVGDEDDWTLKVIGKGSKMRFVPIPSLAREALARYLVQRKLSPEPMTGPRDANILASLDNEEISSARLWAILKRFFEVAANAVQENSPGLAIKLKNASPHWMRHTHATHALQKGASLQVVRDNLGHSNISVTSGYVSDDEKKRRKEMEDIFSAS